MTSKDILQPQIPVERLFPPLADSSSLVLAIAPRDYSASAIARAVEDCDAHLLNLNILADRHDDGLLRVAIRIDHRNAGAVARSLARYGIQIEEVEQPETFDDTEQIDNRADDTGRRRALELLRYLSI